MPTDVSPFDLEGIVCVLAGNRGLIGAACEKVLLSLGARVLGFDRDEHDISDPASMERYFGSLDPGNAREMAFINASYPRTDNFGRLSFDATALEDWNRNFRDHLGSAFHFAKLGSELLRDRGLRGSLVHFSSIYGAVGPDLGLYEGTEMTNPVPYGPMKAAIQGMSRTFAVSLAKDGIRSNCVAPGGVYNGQPESFVRRYSARVPFGRMATPDEIAGPVAFLVSPASAYVTAQVLTVDGGWTAI